jgi:hypothetical protein
VKHVDAAQLSPAPLWTAERLATLRRCAAAGLTEVEAAAGIDVPVSAVRAACFAFAIELAASPVAEPAAPCAHATAPKPAAPAAAPAAKPAASTAVPAPKPAAAKPPAVEAKAPEPAPPPAAEDRPASAAPAPTRVDVGISWEGWSERRVEALRVFVDKGWSASRIANSLGVTRNAVIGKCGRLGLSIGGVSLKKIASPPAAPRAPRRRAGTWSPERDAALRRLAETRTAQHAAEVLGLPIGAVRTRAESLGLSFAGVPMKPARRAVFGARGLAKGDHLGLGTVADVSIARPPSKRSSRLGSAGAARRAEALAEIKAAAAEDRFPDRITLRDLPASLTRCRFPLWDQPPADREQAFFCGAETRDPACPYCPGHAALCLQPLGEPSRAAA